jgi:carbon monoxide dehydrogenase subunit G
LKIEGRYSFFSGPELVWARLLETEVLAGCIPGCREFTAVDEDNYEVEINAGFGAISGTFNGTIKVIKRDAPRSFRMVVEGKGPAGGLSGDALLTLHNVGGATEIELAGDAQATGILARLGQRLMDPASKVMIDKFFDCLRDKVDTP